MGNQHGNPVIRNSSRYQIQVTGYTDAWMSPGEKHQFECHCDHYTVHVTALENDREMKKKTFDSWKHDSWDIQNDYIQRHDHANMLHPEEHYEYWSTDNTSYWTQINEQTERAKREERETQKREEERSKQEGKSRQEEEQRRRQEEELPRRQNIEEGRSKEEEERTRREEEEQIKQIREKEEAEEDESLKNSFKEVTTIDELENRRNTWAEQEIKIKAEQLATDFVERIKIFVQRQDIDYNGAATTTVPPKNKFEFHEDALCELFNHLLNETSENNSVESSEKILKMFKDGYPNTADFYSETMLIVSNKLFEFYKENQGSESREIQHLITRMFNAIAAKIDDEFHFQIIHRGLQSGSCAEFVLKYLAETSSRFCIGHEPEILEDIFNLGREWILENSNDTVAMVLSKIMEEDRWSLEKILEIGFLCDSKIQKIHILVKRMLDENNPQKSLDAYLNILQSSVLECTTLREIWTVLDAYVDSGATQANEIFVKTVLVLTELSDFFTETTISYLISEVNQEDSVLRSLAQKCIFHAVKNCSVKLNEKLVNNFLKWLEDDDLRMLTYSVIFMTTVDQQILPDDLIIYLSQILNDKADSPKILSWILACAKDNSQELDVSTVTLLEQLLKDDDGNWACSAIEQFSTIIRHLFENGQDQTEEESYEWRSLHVKVAFLENLCVDKEQSEKILKSLLSNDAISEDKRAYVLAHAAVSYLNAGKIDVAEEYLKKALELKNEYPWANRMLYRTQFLLGNYEEVLQKKQDFEKSEVLLISQTTFKHLRTLCETIKENYEKDMSTELIQTMLVQLEGHPNAQKVVSFLSDNSEYITDDIILSVAVEDWVEAVLLNIIKTNLVGEKNESLIAEVDEAWKMFQCYHDSYLRYSEASDNLLIDIINTYIPDNTTDLAKILKYCCVSLELAQSLVVEKKAVKDLKNMWFNYRISVFFPDSDDDDLATIFELYKQTCLSEYLDLTEDFFDCFCPVNNFFTLKDFLRFLSEENIETKSVSRLILPLETEESRNLIEKRKILERECISKFTDENQAKNPEEWQAHINFLALDTCSSERTEVDCPSKYLENGSRLTEFVEVVDKICYTSYRLKSVERTPNTIDSSKLHSQKSEKTIDVFETTSVKPTKSICVSSMMNNLKCDLPLKNSKPVTRPAKKLAKDVEDNSFEPPEKSSSLSGNFGKGNRLHVSSIQRKHNIGATPGEIADLCCSTGKPVQLYIMNESDSLEFDRSVGRGFIRKQDSLKLLFRPPTEDDSRGWYDIIQQDKSGEIMIVLLQSKKSPLKKLRKLADKNIFAKVKKFCLSHPEVVSEAKKITKIAAKAIIKAVMI